MGYLCDFGMIIISNVCELLCVPTVKGVEDMPKQKSDDSPILEGMGATIM